MKHRLLGPTALAVFIGVATTAAHAVIINPANPLPNGVVDGAFTFEVGGHPAPPSDTGYTLSLSAPGEITAPSTYLASSLGATLGDEATAIINFSPGTASLSALPYSIANYDAHGQVKVTYQIEYIDANAGAGAVQTLHMTTSDLVSATGYASARATLLITDSAIPTPPGGPPPPPGGGAPPGGVLPSGPPPMALYNQTDCTTGA